MKLSHRNAILFSGLLWLAIGTLLLVKGGQYLVLAGNQVLMKNYQGFSLIKEIARFSRDTEQASLILICIALGLGFIKGRFVLKKSVHRIVSRIRSFPANIPFSALYPRGYLFLLAGMMLMGFLFKVLPLPLDVKGFIDFTIGAALINGAMLYFRAALALQRAQ